MKKTIAFTLLALGTLTASAQLRLNANNIDAVVKAMTLQEKAEVLVGCIDGTNYFGFPKPTGSDPSSKILIPGAAGQTNLISRLSIPSIVLADGTAGLRIKPERPNDPKKYYCTGFPVPILMASTWNTSLVSRVGQTLGNEMKEYGVDLLLAPGNNIMRNPLCGRNFEYYSEDPFLSGLVCTAMVEGLQGTGVGVSVKHFAANNQETNRGENNSLLDQRTLREIYLKPFEIVVKRAKPWTVMSAYNKLNGVHCQENYDLLTTVLRSEWGFRGVVVTDWTGTRNTPAQVHAGNDLMMPGTREQIQQIVDAVKAGQLAESDVDLCVKRVLQLIVKTPRFKGYAYSESPDLNHGAEVSRQAASEGMVLLKNQASTLPMADTVKTIALFGISSYDFLADGAGSGHVSTPYVRNLVDGLEHAGYTINAPLRQLYDKNREFMEARYEFSPAKKIPFIKTIGISPRPDEVKIAPYVAEACAAQSDMAIITIGRKPSEGSDRSIKNDFLLTDIEQQMIANVCQAYHAAGKRVLVILNTGGVVETASWKEKPDAILLAWMPGEEGGNAVADILTGKVNPSGHLPITFPINYSDVPSAKNFPLVPERPDDGMNGLTAIMHPENWKNVACYDSTRYEEGIYVGYRHYTTHGVPVSYPFGFGLCYTTFQFSGLSAKPSHDGFVVKVTVKNTGSRAGQQVAQCYVSAPKTSLDRPVRELKAFAKTRLLQPGESQTLTMTFSTYDLAAFHVDDSRWQTDAGQYTVFIGSDADNMALQVPLQVRKTTTYRVNNVLK